MKTINLPLTRVARHIIAGSFKPFQTRWEEQHLSSAAVSQSTQPERGGGFNTDPVPTLELRVHSEATRGNDDPNHGFAHIWGDDFKPYKSVKWNIHDS